MSAFARSVGAQLSLALLLVVAIALGIVYLTVVPSLRDRAVKTRVTQMEGIAKRVRPEVTDIAPIDPEFVATASQENESVRIALLDRINSQSTVVPQQDTFPVSRDLQGDPVATRALDSGRPSHGTVSRNETTYAEAAVPVLNGRYALLVRAPVEIGSIRLVERRVLLAAGARVGAQAVRGRAADDRQRFRRAVQGGADDGSDAVTQ